MTKDLFSYGTLMCEDIMLAVTGRRLSSLRGFLRDYQRRTVKGEAYPGLIPDGVGSSQGSCTATLRDAD